MSLDLGGRSVNLAGRVKGSMDDGTDSQLVAESRPCVIVLWLFLLEVKRRLVYDLSYQRPGILSRLLQWALLVLPSDMLTSFETRGQME
jgi:hypothetical protein